MAIRSTGWLDIAVEKIIESCIHRVVSKFLTLLSRQDSVTPGFFLETRALVLNLALSS